jgi:hypothetical protein
VENRQPALTSRIESARRNRRQLAGGAALAVLAIDLEQLGDGRQAVRVGLPA